MLMHMSQPMPPGRQEKSDLEQLAAASPARREVIKERVSRIRAGMTVDIPFFGHLLLKMDIRIAEPWMGVPTLAVTRDRRMYLNPDFVDALADDELAGGLVHEVLHVALLCWDRQGSRNVRLRLPDGQVIEAWNVAHDYAINLIIDEMSAGSRRCRLPAGGLLDHRFDKMSAEEIYDVIVDEANKNGGAAPGDAADGWGADDMRDDLGGEGGADGDGNSDKDGEGKKPPGKGRPRNEAKNRELDQYWKVSVMEAAQIHEQKNKGNLPLGIRKYLDELTDPKINWKDALSRWAGENGNRADFTYRRPARRSEAVGEMLPYMKRHGVDKIVVGWDTSGSMNGRETEIFSEMVAICDDLGLSLRVICVDTQIHSDQSDVREPEDVDVRGGGGSDYTPMFDLLEEEEYEGVLICFTDGYITVPAVKPPHIRAVLWVLWEGRDIDPTDGRWGETLIVDEDGNAR